MYDILTALDLWAKKIREDVNCCLPARVVQVNTDGSVNVVAIRNDEIDDCVITVPVIRTETNRAYIELKIKEGDRGIVKFCDKSIENYRLTGNESYSGDNRVHSLSDGIFQLGFLPDNEKFEFPEGEIVIGLKNNKFILSVNENGVLTLTAKEITINTDKTDLTSPVVNVIGNMAITGNVTIDGNTAMTGSLSAGSGTMTGNITVADVVSNGISFNTHKHGGVTGGNSKTGVPE